MSFSALSLYTLTLIIAVASPGPAIAAIVGFVLARGIAGAFYFIAGIIFGEFFWLAASIFGVEALIAKYPQSLLLLRFFGVLFLLNMAFNLWKKADHPISALEIKGETALKLFTGGLILSASNPKVMVFYLSLLPSLIAGQNLGGMGYIVYAIIMLAVTSGVFAGYAMMAEKARGFLSDPKALKLVQRINALLLGSVALVILALTLKSF